MLLRRGDIDYLIRTTVFHIYSSTSLEHRLLLQWTNELQCCHSGALREPEQYWQCHSTNSQARFSAWRSSSCVLWISAKETCKSRQQLKMGQFLKWDYMLSLMHSNWEIVKISSCVLLKPVILFYSTTLPTMLFLLSKLKLLNKWPFSKIEHQPIILSQSQNFSLFWVTTLHF